MNYLAPSLLAADFSRLREQVEAVTLAGAEYIHLDVMDGDFVPSISFGAPVIAGLRPYTDKVFDVHMMVKEPGRYVLDMKQAGADLICIHAEACIHLDRTVAQVKELGLKCGVALNPATPLEVLHYLLPQLDMVLIMSVNPGFGGQTFIPYTLEKVKKLRSLCNERGLNIDIEVDGGVNLENAKLLLDAGANILVAGSSIFKGDAAKNTKEFLTLF